MPTTRLSRSTEIRMSPSWDRSVARRVASSIRMERFKLRRRLLAPKALLATPAPRVLPDPSAPRGQADPLDQLARWALLDRLVQRAPKVLPAAPRAPRVLPAPQELPAPPALPVRSALLARKVRLFTRARFALAMRRLVAQSAAAE